MLDETTWRIIKLTMEGYKKRGKPLYTETPVIGAINYYVLDDRYLVVYSARSRYRRGINKKLVVTTLDRTIFLVNLYVSLAYGNTLIMRRVVRLGYGFIYDLQSHLVCGACVAMMHRGVLYGLCNGDATCVGILGKYILVNRIILPYCTDPAKLGAVEVEEKTLMRRIMEHTPLEKLLPFTIYIYKFQQEK